MNSIGQPSVLSPTESSSGHSLRSATFRKQLAGLSGSEPRERSHHARTWGSLAQPTVRDRRVHRPQGNSGFRDDDWLVCTSSLPSLEAAEVGLGQHHWIYSSNVSFEHYVDCGETQENRAVAHGKVSANRTFAEKGC